MLHRPYAVRLIAASLVLAAGLYAGMTFPRAGASASSLLPGVGLFHLDDALSNASNQSSYSEVIISQDDAAAAAALPGRSLVYFAAVAVNTKWNAGVTYAQASSNGWLLKDASGNLLVNKSYPDDYIGDVGSSAYQAAWVANVSAFLASSGADGVFMDDVVRDPRPDAGTYPAKYPTQASWDAAMVSFVKYVGTALKAKGYYVLVNASGYTPGDPGSDDGSLTAQFWQELGPSVNGLCTEFWQQTSDGSYTARTSGPSWNQNWDGWQRLVSTAQDMGDDFVGLTYGNSGDTKAMTYADASFLLDWNGGGGSYMFDPFDNSDPWNTAWTTNIGAPAAAKQQVGAGWMRLYAGGAVLVNPSSSSSQTFALGASYLTPAGQAVTSVTLAPTTGLILHSSGVPLAPTTTPSPAITTTATASAAPVPLSVTTPAPAPTVTTSTTSPATTPTTPPQTQVTTTTAAPSPAKPVTTTTPTTTTTTPATTTTTTTAATTPVSGPTRSGTSQPSRPALSTLLKLGSSAALHHNIHHL